MKRTLKWCVVCLCALVLFTPVIAVAQYCGGGYGGYGYQNPPQQSGWGVNGCNGTTYAPISVDD